MFRNSRGSLFLTLLYLSIGCAALVKASGVWPQVAVTLTLAILVVFSLGAIFWTERRRVYAIGFSATGWLYFLLVFSDVTNVRPYLLTETAMSQLYDTMHGDQPIPIGLVNQPRVPSSGPAGLRKVTYAAPLPPPLPAPRATGNNAPAGFTDNLMQNVPPTTYVSIASGQSFVDFRSFSNVGHSIWAMIVAFVGGITAKSLARGRKQASTVRKDETSSP